MNKTWELVDIPRDKDVIGVKWVYKTKHKAHGSIKRYKARLVAEVFSQKLGIDYNETFVAIVMLDTLRILLAIEPQFKWNKIQLNFKYIYF